MSASGTPRTNAFFDKRPISIQDAEQFAATLERELAQARNAALEEAAKVCDSEQVDAEKRAESEYVAHNNGWAIGAINCSQKIRALKTPAAQPAEQNAAGQESQDRQPDKSLGVVSAPAAPEAAPQEVAQMVRASGKSAEAEDTEGRGFESRPPAAAALDPVAVFHQVVVREWEKAYERPMAVPLPNEPEKVAIRALAARYETRGLRGAAHIQLMRAVGRHGYDKYGDVEAITAAADALEGK